MHTGYHALVGAAAHIPVNPPKPIISFSPVVLPAPGRPVDLQLRVTVPLTGDALPIILLSHGHGRSNSLSSLEGYAPLAEFWAAHGFAVLQPTHLSSAFLGLKGRKGQEMFWQDRTADMVRILDNLDTVEMSMPELKGRLDRARVAVAGHSLGGWTTAMLLGASNTDPRNGSTWYKLETRIKAGVILAGTGNGGADISDFGKTLVPFYGPNFSKMARPALVVYGDEDQSPFDDPCGWDAGETLDESPERLATVQRMTWAYLKSQFYEGDTAWAEACHALGRDGSEEKTFVEEAREESGRGLPLGCLGLG
ncbi:hypothetical protein V501_02657 [Pseudogymnoascus sp. VKM F-4519 (FW-2642)]|nr:hypothetical protein V501_02657 [Pseudogymnoascus sp. VKM F-4519 (FW-2642)]